MPTIEHDLLPKRNVPPNLETTVLESEEEEALFHQEMLEMQRSLDPQPIQQQLEVDPLKDPLIEKELKKKKTLEKLLLFKTPHTKNVEIDGVVFTLKLLNSNESNTVLKEVMKLDNEEQLTRSSLILLSAALIEANGIKLEETYSGPEEITSTILQRYYELSQWHAPIINLLVKAYQAFVAEVEGEFSQSFLNKSPETPTTS
jgi:hypothetical protein